MRTPAPPPPLDQIPPEIACVSDYEAPARERLGEAAWAYLCGGAADELTLRDNREAFRRLRLNNRVLADLAGGHTRLELFGDRFEHPVLIAPVAHQALAHPDAELATVLAATAVRAGMTVSTQSSVTLEDIARGAAQVAQREGIAAPPLWFQLYVQPDRGITRELVARAQAAGYRAIVITVDAPVHGPRNREQRSGFVLPAGLGSANLRDKPAQAAAQTMRVGQGSLFDGPLLAQAPTWADIEALRAATPLPLLLKGITSVADARRAADAGVGGIVVSNHGGRTLDTLPATIDALPPIADAVGDRLTLLLDGGIRRGTDVLKALALGARAVLVGRPIVQALAAAGALGVAHVLHLLRSELEIAMALTGCRTLADIDASVLWRPAPGPDRGDSGA